MPYTDNKGIIFNTFDGNSFPRTKKVGNNKNGGATVDDLANIAANNGGSLPSIVNAVEIDWNGAKPGWGEDSTNGITTTGELMKGVYSPMFAKVKQFAKFGEGFGQFLC